MSFATRTLSRRIAARAPSRLQAAKPRSYSTATTESIVEKPAFQQYIKEDQNLAHHAAGES